MQTLDLTPDIEFDIEEELNHQERVHALAYCTEHEGWRPENGAIVQGLCGTLFRVNWNRTEGEKCLACDDLFHIPKSGHCWLCGKTA